MASALDDLDEAQLTAVTAPSRLVAVLAGAGSGKTRVLTRRIAWRVQEGTAGARHTLALTFTREAAGELRRRLRRLGMREQITSGTFHAVMLGMLRQRAGDHRLAPPQIVTVRHRLVHEIGAGAATDAVVAEADWCAARAIDVAEYQTAARLAGRRPSVGFDRMTELLRAYATEKRRRGVIDINDVLVQSLELLRTDAAFADAVRWRFRHVHVDEAQDLNPVQHRLVHELTDGCDDLYLVGDPAQAIYGFNGADPSLLVDVADHFPGVEVVRLAANHRCTPQVVDFGRHVLTTADQPADVTSSRFDGAGVTEICSADEHHECTAIATLLAGIDPSRLRGGEVAVLARTNAHVGRLRDAIGARGIPIRHRVDAAGTPVGRVLDLLARTSSAQQLRAFAHAVLDEGATVDSGEPHSVERRAAERLVATTVLEFLREQPQGAGPEFASWRNSTDPFASRNSAGVDLLTFHAAKGREWDTVVLAGVETGLVPHRSATTIERRHEEARLLYVATTRARERLIVSRAERRGGYARRRSPFVEGFTFGEVPAVPMPDELHDRAVSAEAFDPVGVALRAWRVRAARSTTVLPEDMCSDRQLAAIAKRRPHTVAELVETTGFGPMTAAQLIDGIVEALAAGAEEQSGTPLSR